MSSKLFVANPTAQTTDFLYVVPDEAPGGLYRASAPRRQIIRPGGQVQIAGDLVAGQIDAIIDQHRVFGMVKTDEVAARQRAGAVVPLVYSIDKPISEAFLNALMTNNTTVLVEEGRQARELAAISVSNGIENDMEDQQMPGKLGKLEFEIVEDRTAKSDGEESVPQRIRVTREAEEGKPQPKPRSRRK